MMKETPLEVLRRVTAENVAAGGAVAAVEEPMMTQSEKLLKVAQLLAEAKSVARTIGDAENGSDTWAIGVMFLRQVAAAESTVRNSIEVYSEDGYEEAKA